MSEELVDVPLYYLLQVCDQDRVREVPLTLPSSLQSYLPPLFYPHEEHGFYPALEDTEHQRHSGGCAK